jgi:hypothetical protein
LIRSDRGCGDSTYRLNLARILGIRGQGPRARLWRSGEALYFDGKTVAKAFGRSKELSRIEEMFCIFTGELAWATRCQQEQDHSNDQQEFSWIEERAAAGLGRRQATIMAFRSERRTFARHDGSLFLVPLWFASVLLDNPARLG